jgi:hypothetical protein
LLTLELSEADAKRMIAWLALVIGHILAYSCVCSLPIETIARKRLGKSSFIQNQGLGTLQKEIASSDDILDLARKSALRKYGSSNYRKAWHHWLHLATLSIRHDLSENLPSPVDRERFENLAFRLGVAADTGEMPSFSDAGARSGYALDFFCRARNLAGLFMEKEDPSYPAGWSDAMLSTPNATLEKSFNLTSLGGGPGFDFVAAALASTFYAAGSEAPSIHATILDYEEGWSNLVKAMDSATRNVLQQPQMSCCWGGKCDITKPVAHPDNAACLAEISSTQLWTCQYCIAENMHLLRESKFVFFQDLFEAAPVGAMFIFTETTPRIWPDFCNLVAEHCG